jgi:hypothetical protein
MGVIKLASEGYMGSGGCAFLSLVADLANPLACMLSPIGAVLGIKPQQLEQNVRLLILGLARYFHARRSHDMREGATPEIRPTQDVEQIGI